MYSEWKSLQSTIQADTSNVSVLDKFPAAVGKEVASSVVRHLAASLSMSVHGNNEPSKLCGDKDVKWTMEVLCFGLHLPLSELDAIKECVNVYCDWLTCLVQPSKVCVPNPVLEDPNTYGQIMIRHLYNLFVPREEASVDQINRQVLLCHRVLRTLQATAKESQSMSRETWETLLKFLLAVNDTLLAPPTLVKGDLGAQLSERILSVLFEIWLLACARCFPAPSMWRTFRDMCRNWRHNPSLIVQWHRVNFLLTSKLLIEMYGPDYPELVVGEADSTLLPTDMDSDCIAQSWFRFLHIIGNPCDLAKPRVIGQTTKFLHVALTNPTLLDPGQHDSLKNLPQIFFRAMKGMSVLVDSFLGMPPPYKEGTPQSSTQQQLSQSLTPPQRRTEKRLSLMQKGSQKSLSTPKIPANPSPSVSASSSPAHLTLDAKPPLAGSRPTVNSILHVFGTWLFEASLVDGTSKHEPLNTDSRASLHGEPLNYEGYDEGLAEALGALCRIFCAHRTGEHILPQYLARFYICLHHGLKIEEPSSGLVLANVLFNSYDILRVDLDGVLVLVPSLLAALELVLSDTPHKVKECEHIPVVELRRASILILLSMLCLPLHYRDFGIPDIYKEAVPAGESSSDPASKTFIALKLRITELLLRALTNETDSSNTHMLLGGLLVLVQDLACCEIAETTTVQRPESAMNSDTSYGLFGGATSLVCNRLMATWKSDLNIALSAIEVLSGLAKVKLNTPNHLMCKRTVKWICDFIVYQCSRPAPAHSKDLHSMIVAAFQSLTLWLVEHHYLLQDKECLHYVLEVVELGISGTKSQNRASDVPKMKAEKELMPASMRVRDAAESVLTCIIEQVGSFPPSCGPEAPYSQIDEESLIRFCKDDEVPDYGSCFRYFVVENSTIVSLLEQPLGNNEDPLPTNTAIVRGPFGRHAWTMQLRHLPRYHKVASKMYLTDPGRPVPCTDILEQPVREHRHFPAMVDALPITKAEESLPSLEAVVKDKARHDLFKQYISNQAETEKKNAEKVKEQRGNRPFPDAEMECKQPSVSHEFQTARLFLSHYGFLTLEALKEPHNSSIPPMLTMLDSTQAGFLESLQNLDNLSSRTSDTAHVFYVKSGQKTATEILRNVSGRRDLDGHFMEFLLSLGWPVDVQRHAGWTGNPSTSWKFNMDISNTSGTQQPNCSLFDGQRHVIYWSDVCSEIVFIVPSTEIPHVEPRLNTETPITVELSPTLSSKQQSVIKPPKTLSLDFDNSPKNTEKDSSPTAPEPLPRTRRSGRQCMAPMLLDCNIFIIWLESYEDAETLPLNDLLLSASHQSNEDSSTHSRTQPEKETQNVFVIMIHALQNGLFRISVTGPSSRIGLPGPLVDGMVVSRRIMGALVRQTAVNIGKRKRLQDSESHQPPHVRRKLKIQDITNRYRSRLTEAEFYTGLFEEVQG